MPARSAASSAVVISTRLAVASGRRWVPLSSRLMLASRYPRCYGVTRNSCGRLAAARIRWPLSLSAGAALGNDQLGVPSGDPGGFPSRQLPETTDLVFVGPYDQLLPRRRAARV